MSSSTTRFDLAHAEDPSALPDRRRVLFATIIGTTVEWYDFFIYGTAAALVFGQLFFAPSGPGMGTILAFLTVGISFLFRPLGAFLAGHFGDRYGRRPVLMATLILMGASTALIGLIPTYASIGIAAPIILVTLRILQGISAGGEWGGAALMAVEHAPERRRGAFGSAPQMGVPLGLLLSSGMMAIMTIVAPGDAFLEWGWRVPFLLSVLLIFVGWYIRRRVQESPVFVEITQRRSETRMPIVQLLREHWMLVLIAALVFAADNAAGYIMTGFIPSYATDPAGSIGMDRGAVLWAVTASSVAWLLTTWAGGALSDRIGRRATLLIGYAVQLVGGVLLFVLVDTGSLGLLLVAMLVLGSGIGLAYGPISIYYAELFPASVRFSGVSITYALGAILGGAFAPSIAAALLQATSTSWSIVAYLLGITVVSIVATLLLRDRTRMPLGIQHETEQSESAFIWRR